MTAYIVRRVLSGFPILLGTTFLLFIIYNFVGGDPAYQLAGKHATVEVLENIRRELGLDRPWYEQYWTLLKNIFSGDFGRSYATREEISDIFARGAVVSLSVTVPPFLFSVCISIVIGMFVAIYRGTWVDKSIVALTVGMQSISILVYILAGQYLLAYEWGLFPISGYDLSWSGRWEYLVLPWLIFVVLSLAPQIRFYRTVILDELYQDYVRTARAKGLAQKRVMLKHVLKNAMIPIITDVVISIPFLILGSLLIENFFSIPGLGNMIVNAIANSDRPVLIATTVLGTIAYIAFNIITDVCYALVDPRVKLK